MDSHSNLRSASIGTHVGEKSPCFAVNIHLVDIENFDDPERAWLDFSKQS